MKKSIFFAIIIFLLVNACLSERDCYDTNTNYVKITFWDAKHVSVSKAIDSVKISDASQIFYKATKSASGLSLPLSPSASSSVIHIYYTDAMLNKQVYVSLHLSYMRNYVMVSSKCNPFVQYQNVTLVSSSGLTSAKIVASTLNTSITSNLEIVF